MAYTILLTSLYENGKRNSIRYFRAKNGRKNYFCDSLLTVEASAKYVLAEYKVDEIITLGRKFTFDEGDSGHLIKLANGKSFYSAQIDTLSTYSLFRYRIAQYIDELKIEQQEIMEQLPEDLQKKIIEFIRQHFRRINADSGRRKFNRLFEDFTESPEEFDAFCKALTEEIPEAAADPEQILTWTKNYLYDELKDSVKLEMLRENQDVTVRFVPTSMTEDNRVPIEKIRELVNNIIMGHTEEDEVNLYVAMNNDDLTDNFVLMNVLELIRVMPDTNVRIRSIITTSDTRNELAGEIRNDTDVYGIAELVAATRAFLQYGRVDMIVEFWEHSGTQNERIESMIYAMRRIDLGISLCSISDIENGIQELRELFSSGESVGGEDYHSLLYTLIAEAIQRDYGPLLEGEEIEFIELVKWAARKKFYQQTLTLIESRAPEAFVKNGIFYYCENEKEKEHALALFAKYRMTLKPFEYYRMNDINHYFIKIHDRRNHKKKGRDVQRSYANYRLEELNTNNPERIRSHSLCEDRELLGNLLYAYYHIGDVRNKTNHAAEDDDLDDSRLFVDQRDVPARMTQIRESVNYFLINYDKVMEQIGDKKSGLIEISPFEVKAVARRMENEEKNKRSE